MAIEKDLYVAVFGYKFLEDDILNTVVFAHQPGGEEEERIHLSMRKAERSPTICQTKAKPRLWSRLRKEDWEQFIDIVKEIPKGFPAPNFKN
ncbi:hypothetical protein GLAREA_07341 [Glarea lozoyensis ATCC 20868]|uniref:Uncharacterized protein n=1 Tax=Glarea lozoyensis (strain ATCC 20868 / MF5171) TaxID=1116229 RepID=S3E120_GLAL2|nr:uncharacterized protein GLAREA_07341 [Glarea lozoyensis ATCC 20868]EPE32208.1 hypothetical protein GLAREA_07341 [Glarea lozoyensis ATCC 20868]